MPRRGITISTSAWLRRPTPCSTSSSTTSCQPWPRLSAVALPMHRSRVSPITPVCARWSALLCHPVANRRQQSSVGGEIAEQEAVVGHDDMGCLGSAPGTVDEAIDNLKIDYRLLPRWSITTTSHDCLRRKCPFFGTSCFVHGARRRAEASHIVVSRRPRLPIRKPAPRCGLWQ